MEIYKYQHYIDKIFKEYYYYVSSNISSNAVDFLIKHPDKIHWNNFSMNTIQAAVDFLIKNPDKIEWNWFSMNDNPAAIEFTIKYYPNKINYNTLAINPILFELDYQAMSLARVRIIEEELCHKAVLDPRRVKVWLDDFLERGGELKDFKYEPYSVSNF